MVSQRTVICGLTLLMLAVVPASADICVWLEPADATVGVGSTTTIDILANFDEPVVAWGLDLLIDEPSYTAWNDMTLGSCWEAPGGSLDGDWLVGLCFPPGVSGDDIVLATLTFEGLSEGVVNLAMSSGPEEDEGFELEFGGLATNVTFAPATLTVVPEPATIALLSVVALFGIRRRR